MRRIFPVLVSIGMALAGCADAYQNELTRKTIETQNVKPENYKPDLLAFMKTYLNDPTNVREATMSEPTKLYGLDTERYAACLRYNAKSAGSKYTGLRDHLAIFVSGKFDRMIELGRATAAGSNSGPLQPLREYCASATYQPVPELEQLKR